MPPLLLAIYVGYVTQSLILFDALPMFLGLFTLFAFIYFQAEPILSAVATPSRSSRPKNLSIFYVGIGALTILVAVLIRTVVLIPFSGNKLIIEGYRASLTEIMKIYSWFTIKYFL